MEDRRFFVNEEDVKADKGGRAGSKGYVLSKKFFDPQITGTKCAIFALTVVPVQEEIHNPLHLHKDYDQALYVTEGEGAAFG